MASGVSVVLRPKGMGEQVKTDHLSVDILSIRSGTSSPYPSSHLTPLLSRIALRGAKFVNRYDKEVACMVSTVEDGVSDCLKVEAGLKVSTMDVRTAVASIFFGMRKLQPIKKIRDNKATKIRLFISNQSIHS